MTTATAPLFYAPKHQVSLVLRTKIGMLFFLATEVMFFAALLASFVVIKAGLSVWPPVGQPRLPVAITAVNTAILLLSLVTFYFAASRYFLAQTKTFMIGLFLTCIMGGAFLMIQGHEWLELIRFGMATSNNVYAGVFYVIVGAHALHVLGGLLLLLFILYKANSSTQKSLDSLVVAGKMYWTVVVLMWPVIYYFLYF